MTQPVVRQEARTFIASDGDEVVGAVVGPFVDYGHQPYGMIEELVVAPGRREAGIGAALLGECRSWLAESGAEVAFVSAVDEDAADLTCRPGSVGVGPWLWARCGAGRE